MQGLDDGSRVIYAGTFSKVLFPGLRLGYVVLPPGLVEPFVAARALADRNPSGLEQAVVAQFITDGHFGRHLRRMRQLYAQRQEVLVEAVERHLKGLLTVESAEAGMHLVGRFPEPRDDVAAAARAASHGVDVLPISEYSIAQRTSGLIMCYTASDPPAIRAAVKKLKTALS
jgi:GntR family transcriptional regulator/MocR family aminotransferase